jgi:hypothetical protein
MFENGLLASKPPTMPDPLVRLSFSAFGQWTATRPLPRIAENDNLSTKAIALSRAIGRGRGGYQKPRK